MYLVFAEVARVEKWVKKKKNKGKGENSKDNVRSKAKVGWLMKKDLGYFFLWERREIELRI